MTETELMVQACLDRTPERKERDSVLFQEWEIDHDTYYFIPASSIVKHAFVIGDLSCALSSSSTDVNSRSKKKRRSNKQKKQNAIVSVVKDITEWGNEFTMTDEVIRECRIREGSRARVGLASVFRSSGCCSDFPLLSCVVVLRPLVHVGSLGQGRTGPVMG